MNRGKYPVKITKRRIRCEKCKQLDNYFIGSFGKLLCENCWEEMKKIFDKWFGGNK